MQLEKQVTSLELSKRLKELGVKQESLFYYFVGAVTGNTRLGYGLHSKSDINFTNSHTYSAFTVAELGELLNEIANRIDCGDTWYHLAGQKKWTVGWGGDMHEELSDTEADARAKMLIYLLENNLIENNGNNN